MAPRIYTPLLIPIALAFAIVACDSQTHSEGAHVHGLARLTIAVESDTEAQLVFEAPAESVYGFEHAPRTPEEQAVQAEALTTLETGFGELLVLPNALGCRIASAEVAVESGGEGENGHVEDEGHSEVRAVYTLICEGIITGAEAEVGLGEAFAGIEELEVILLNDDGQQAERLEGGVGRVDL